jgi:BirA family biotin operon repressor/biotin-[acetyl-CoA-carboxylase] ligase
VTAAPEPLPDDLAQALASAGTLKPIATRVVFYSAIGSTNDVAAELAAEPHGEGAVVIANAQTAGRGRRGRTWFSPAGSGLYVSVVLAPGRARAPDRATELVTLMAGVALAEGVERATGLAPQIKWPNDLQVGGRKLAGILAEGVSTARAAAPAATTGLMRVVLGFGINIATTACPPELRTRITSLETELGRPIDRATVCASLLTSLSRRYADLLAGRFDAILSDWRDRAPGSRGRRVRWDESDGPRSGTTVGIDNRGGLLVQVGDVVERIVAGDVTWE